MMDKILHLAVREIESKGIRRFRIGVFCKSVGISRVTFYSYYSSKDQLIQIALFTIFERWLLRLDTVLNSKKPTETKLRALFEFKEEIMNSTSQSLLNDLRDPSENISILYKDFEDLFLKRFESLLLECRKAGVINKRLTNAVIFVFARTLQCMDRDSFFLKEIHSAQERRKILFQLFLRGLSS